MLTHFMSLEQAFTLLEKEIDQGLYTLPQIATLTARERNIRDSGLPVTCALSLPELKLLINTRTSKQKYYGRCYEIPCRILEPKKLTMVCLLQNTQLTKKYTGITRFT